MDDSIVFAVWRQCAGPSNIRFVGLTEVPNPNGISIGSAVVAGLTTMTDRQTDRQTDHATPSVTISRIYVLRCGLKYNTKNVEDKYKVTTVLQKHQEKEAF